MLQRILPKVATRINHGYQIEQQEVFLNFLTEVGLHTICNSSGDTPLAWDLPRCSQNPSLKSRSDGGRSSAIPLLLNKLQNHKMKPIFLLFLSILFAISFAAASNWSPPCPKEYRECMRGNAHSCHKCTQHCVRNAREFHDEEFVKMARYCFLPDHLKGAAQDCRKSHQECFVQGTCVVCMRCEEKCQAAAMSIKDIVPETYHLFAQECAKAKKRVCPKKLI